MKLSSFFVIILVAINSVGQVKPKEQKSNKETRQPIKVDESRLDTIANTHNKIIKILREEMKMKPKE